MMKRPPIGVSLAVAGTGIVLLAAAKVFINRSKNRVDGKIGKNCVVLVTGCDTPLGFGTAIARKLHQLGYIVFAACLDAEKAKSAVYYELARDNDFHVIQMDVTNDMQVESARAFVEQYLYSHPGLRFTGLVNNAGISSFGVFEWQSLETFKKLMDVNFFGFVRISKALLPLLRRDNGRIVVMASLASELPNKGVSAYSASKTSLLMALDCLRYELEPFNIFCSAICPDFYKTNLITDQEKILTAIAKEKSLMSSEVFSAYGGNDRLASMKKSLTETMPPQAKEDLSPVVNCVVDALTSTKPKQRYHPMEFQFKIVRAIYFVVPSLYDFLISHIPD